MQLKWLEWAKQIQAISQAGLEVQPVRLLGVLDKKFHDHPPAASHVDKMFILCEVTGGEAQAGLETLQVGYFGEDELPPLSAERVTLKQIQWLFQTRNSAHEVWLDLPVNCELS